MAEAAKEILIDNGLGGKYLTFSLGSEEYGVGILKVREIIGIMEINLRAHQRRPESSHGSSV